MMQFQEGLYIKYMIALSVLEIKQSTPKARFGRPLNSVAFDSIKSSSTKTFLSEENMTMNTHSYMMKS